MSSSSAVVCREVFDENSQPSAEEISDYAQQIGIDPESESHLMPLAKEGLMQALPPPWKAYYDEKLQTHYYFNEETKKTQWEHPLDQVYRDLVKKARDSSVIDDTCASVQELPTSEEHTKHLERVETKVESDDDDLTTDSGERSDIKEGSSTLKSGMKRLNPLGRPPLAPLMRSDKKLADMRISSLRRSIDSSVSPKPTLFRNTSDRDLIGRASFERPKTLYKQQSEIIDLKMHVLDSPEEEGLKPLLSLGNADRGLSLTGKGSLFLKLSKSDLPSPDTDKSLPLDSVTKSDPPKGILREKMTDSLQKRAELLFGRSKQTVSFDEDKKSVRFNLENPPEPTMSPGSNSSSEQNEGQSSIISAAPAPQISSPVIPSSITNLSSLLSPMTIPPTFGQASPTGHLPKAGLSTPLLPTANLPKTGHPIVLAPLVSRPPLPPRSSNESLKEVKNSGSDRDSLDGETPRRRVVRPPAADYIKPDLFQKDFQKISDIVRTVSPDNVGRSDVGKLEPPSEKEVRPRSPLIPQKNKISINLMESIESETSIDSPDKEYDNFDLNDLDESNNLPKDEKDSPVKDIEDFVKESSDISEKSIHSKSPRNNMNIPQIKVPNLDLLKQAKSFNYDSDDSKKSTTKDEHSPKSEPKSSVKSDIEIPKDTRIFKVSPTPSLNSDLRSPKVDYTKQWSPLSTFKPLNKAVIAPQIKSSDSASSLGKNLSSPKLDGVIISQGKSSDNVVVVYQFESQEESLGKQIKSPMLPDASTRDLERNKADERRRLEFSLQKELESIRAEYVMRERRMRAELQEEFREQEEKFLLEKRVRLNEQSERHKREMEEALSLAENKHKQLKEEALLRIEEKYNRDVEVATKLHDDKMSKIQEEFRSKLMEMQRKLELDNERSLAEMREQFQLNLNRERSRLMEENRATVESIRNEHNSRISDLRQDYRAEVERLRTQHACHLEELRQRLANERTASTRQQDERQLADKYRCLKEKYARLKHDVKMSIERRNKRREMSMTTGSETEKSNSNKQNQERSKDLNETRVQAVIESSPRPRRTNNNDTSQSDNKTTDNNNHDWCKGNPTSPDTTQTSEVKARPRKTTVAFKEPTRKRDRDKNRDGGATTDCQDSSDATTADEKPKEVINGHNRRRCFTRLKSASTSRLNYSPKRGDGWSSPLESLRQQLRKLDELEDQFPDLAIQPAYSLRYPFTGLGSVAADSAELEFVRHRALVEREGVRRARTALRARSAALADTRATDPPPHEERSYTELEVALHRARALLGEKEIRLRHIERALKHMAESHPPPSIQETTTSDPSSGSEAAGEAAGGAVLRSLRALHADVRDIWRALDARRATTASPESSSCNPPSLSNPKVTLSAPEPSLIQDNSDGGVAERARGLRAWLQTAP